MMEEMTGISIDAYPVHTSGEFGLSMTKPRNNGEWTAGRRQSFIVSVLRNGTRRYPPKFQTLSEAKTEKKVNPKTNRVAQHYLCAVCTCDFPAKDVQVDHIVPVVGTSGFTTWDEYINNLFCEKHNLQVLCKECHGSKTKEERLHKAMGKEQSRASQSPSTTLAG